MLIPSDSLELDVFAMLIPTVMDLASLFTEACMDGASTFVGDL